VELDGFQYQQLYELSRAVERTYGLMESPTQAITGVVTHSILSGIRTELLRKAPTIFDVIEPTSVGSKLTKTFGVRSGQDGVLRFLKEHADKLAGFGLEATPQTANEIFALLDSQWAERSRQVSKDLLQTMEHYQTLLHRAFFTEEAMLEWLMTTLAARQKKVE
jgi:homocitrate synthase NifV